MVDQTANERLRSLQIQHEIRARRFSRDLSKRIARLLEQANRAARDRLAARLARSIDTGPWTTRHTEAVVADLASEARNWRARAEGIATAELQDLAAWEADWQANTLNRNTPIEWQVSRPSPELLRAAVTQEPFYGRLMSEWWDDLETAQVRGMAQAVRLGVVEGKSIRDMARDVRQVADRGQREAETVVRTAVATITNKARAETYKANEDVLDSEQWIAMLDGRTCIICGGLDKQIFAVGEGPIPPEHPSCRCVRIPITKSFKEMGIEGPEEEPTGRRAFVRSTGPVAGIPEERRGELIGDVPVAVSYPEWLAEQPREFVEEVLGPTRAALFLDGKLKIERFVDQDLEPLTLEELKQDRPTAWRRMRRIASS